MAGYQTGNEITADWNGPKMVVGKTNFATWWPQEVLSQLESQSLHTLSVVELPLPAVIPCAKQQKSKEKKKEKKQKKAALALHHRCQDLYTERVCHCLHSHVLVVCVAIALCMLCAFCRLWGGCHTPAYTKQPVFNLTATYTQREFVIDSQRTLSYVRVSDSPNDIEKERHGNAAWMKCCHQFRTSPCKGGCVFCRSRGGCPTSVYTKQQVFNRTATYTQREFVIDCILMLQLYVFPLCFVCFMCFAVHGVIAPRRFIQNNQCLIGRPHIHRESLSLIVFSCFSCTCCHCALYALYVLPFVG